MFKLDVKRYIKFEIKQTLDFGINIMTVVLF